MRAAVPVPEPARLVCALHPLRRLPAVLTAIPPNMSDDEKALLTVVQQIRRTEVYAGLTVVVAGLHLVGAVTMIAAPDNQLFTQGTQPVFDLFGPMVWAVWFGVGGVSACSLLVRITEPRQLLTWITVLPAQTVWLAASLIAVAQGGGSAMGVVFLAAVLAFTLVTAAAVWLAYTSGKR